MSIRVEPLSPLHEVVDEALDAYVGWREECDGAREAYRRWSSAARADRMLAFCAYLAALDREEVAANVYSDAMRRLGDEFANGPLAEPRRAWGGCSS